MAESLVIFLIEKLGTLLDNEANLFGQVRENVLCLRGELGRMAAFLKIADSLEESDEEVSVWVRQVREIAQETEDVLAEYTLLQNHNHNHEPGLYGSFRRLTCCVKNVKSCYRIAGELRSINARVSRIAKAQKRICQKFSRIEQGGGGGPSVWQDRREDAVLLDKSDLVGIDERERKLADWLTRGESRREVVSLTGQGGMGKTTLAKQVYEEAEVKKHFRVRAWAAVSQSFEIEDLLRDLVEQLYAAIRRRVPPAVEKMKINRLKETIKEMLQTRRYLIVLDDVWTLQAWRSVQHVLPNNSLGSRVMLTTRNNVVASTACVESYGKTYNLEPLTQQDSWELLCRKAFQGTPCPPHLDEICRYILKKCEGLPLAIVAISGVLATKDTRRMDEWDLVARSLGAEIDGNDQLKDLKKVLSLSFNDLPYYLKSCFLYLSIFPEDHLIERMRLIRLWVAEGFIKAQPGKVLEDVAEEYLKDLLDRSLMQVASTTSDGRVKAFRIHDLVREIIISKARDQNFAAIVNEQYVQWSERAQRLSVHYTLQHLHPKRSVSHLHALFMFEVSEKLRLYRLFPDSFKILAVLDVQNSYITKFPNEVYDLLLLKYLSLRHTKVKTVPVFIGKLQNLETLDLKHTQVTELPVEVLKLHKLRHLLVYRTEFVSNELFGSKSGFNITGNIGALQSLQKLCFIEANQRSLVRELGKLHQLRRLGIVKLRRNDGRALCSSIERLTNLRALSIASVQEDEIIDLKHLSTPPMLLQRLYVRGRLETCPDWIPALDSLVKLSLKWSKLNEDVLEYLQHLPNLVDLVLCQVYTGKQLWFRDGGFKKLKILGLDEFEELRRIEVEPGAMEILEDLSIRRCELLETVPSGMEHLKKLKLVEFCDMPAALFDTLRPGVKDSENWRVAHVSEVYSTYWREGEWKVYSLESLSDGENCPLPSTLKIHERWK